MARTIASALGALLFVGVSACNMDNQATAREPCDEALLEREAEAVTARRAAWSPAEGRPIAIALDAGSAIWRACPSMHRDYRSILLGFIPIPKSSWELAGDVLPPDAVFPVESRLPGYSARVHAARDDDDDGLYHVAGRLANEACPNLSDIYGEVLDMKRGEAQGHYFDRCRLGRYPLFTRDEFIARGHFPRKIHAYTLYLRLQERGVSEPTARSLLRALLSDPNPLWPKPGDLHETQRVPSARRGEPYSGGIPVHIRPLGIDVYGIKDMVKLTGGMALRGGADNELAVAATAAQTRIAARSADEKRYLGATLVVDPDAPWPTVLVLSRALYMAGVTKLSALVLVDEIMDPYREIALHEEATREAEISVLVEDTSILLTCGDQPAVSVSLAELEAAG
ncbi:MAG: hypothetical protein KC636_22365, partial [Myxococcales bacterium]|nr:hypothetical protein [Myxococcales bacterium]